MLAIANASDGMSRAKAAKLAGMDRQTMRRKAAWIFGAICPPRDTGAALVMPDRHRGHAGHTAASFTIDHKRTRIVELLSARPLPLARCRADSKLPHP